MSISIDVTNTPLTDNYNIDYKGLINDESGGFLGSVTEPKSGFPLANKPFLSSLKDQNNLVGATIDEGNYIEIWTYSPPIEHKVRDDLGKELGRVQIDVDSDKPSVYPLINYFGRHRIVDDKGKEIAAIRLNQRLNQLEINRVDRPEERLAVISLTGKLLPRQFKWNVKITDPQAIGNGAGYSIDSRVIAFVPKIWMWYDSDLRLATGLPLEI